MANTFDEKTINGSVEIANMAGIESTANTTSVVSTINNTMKSGVIIQCPA
jgi:O-acetylhomoserine/O-acetylserine sulfhydrylase-like pyridoxal-dependent enzyme